MYCEGTYAVDCISYGLFLTSLKYLGLPLCVDSVPMFHLLSVPAAGLWAAKLTPQHPNAA
jgi:hypothetical protein